MKRYRNNETIQMKKKVLDKRVLTVFKITTQSNPFLLGKSNSLSIYQCSHINWKFSAIWTDSFVLNMFERLPHIPPVNSEGDIKTAQLHILCFVYFRSLHIWPVWVCRWEVHHRCQILWWHSTLFWWEWWTTKLL